MPFVKEILVIYLKGKGEEGRQEVLDNHSLNMLKSLKSFYKVVMYSSCVMFSFGVFTVQYNKNGFSHKSLGLK